MAVLSHDNYESIATVLSTELNSLANAGYSSASSAQGSDSVGGPLYGDFELVLASTGLDPTVYQIAELYLLRSADGTNYEDAPSATNSGSGMLAGTFIGGDDASGKRIVLPDVSLPPGLWKAVLKNTSGDSWHSSGNTLKLRAHNIQSA